jgi:hypothetical protein
LSSFRDTHTLATCDGMQHVMRGTTTETQTETQTDARHPHRDTDRCEAPPQRHRQMRGTTTETQTDARHHHRDTDRCDARLYDTEFDT